MEKVVKRWIAKVLRTKPISDDSGALDAKETIKCLGCDNQFKPFKNKAYCTQLCYQRHRRLKRKRERKPLICTVCGEEFLPTKTNAKRCSEKCRKIYVQNYFADRYKKYRKRRTTKPPERRKCKHCGIEYEVTRPNRIYCSFECRNQHKFWVQKTTPVKWAPSLREVTDKDIQTSKYAEEIKAFKASGKKIITLPTITPATHEVNVEGLGVDNDRFAEDLSNFNSKYPKVRT